MKVNCDAFSDWLKARKEAKKQWHRRFKFYIRLGHGDCRLFEFVEARRVEQQEVCYGYGYDYDVIVQRWEYRAIQSLTSN